MPSGITNSWIALLPIRMTSPTCRIEYVREAGSEGIELVMWLIARGAAATTSVALHPPSNTTSFTSRRQTRRWAT